MGRQNSIGNRESREGKREGIQGHREAILHQCQHQEVHRILGEWQKKVRDFCHYLSPVLVYWIHVLEELQQPLLPTPSELVEGFWPDHDWRVLLVASPHLPTNAQDVTLEDKEPEAYCGPANMRPVVPFNQWRQIQQNWWVLLRRAELDICLLWLGRATSGVCRDKGDANYGKFLIHYWEPQNSAQTLVVQYADCWSGKWVIEKRCHEWASVDVVVYVLYLRTQSPKTRTIPRANKAVALVNLERSNNKYP
jgi:hypothetical protein